MRPPRMIVPPTMDGLYHVVSRVVDRRMIFGEAEKRRFRELLVAYAEFSGIEVVAWCLMDNHFHLLLHVPSKERMDPASLAEKEILRRLKLIYGPAEMTDIRRVLGMCPEEESRRRYLARFTRRMGDLAMFMKTLKQRFSQWYNGRNGRKGTLWEERYRSVVVEIQDLASFGHAARVVAGYIDLNPVRAGMVEDPKDYAWSGYGRAVRGEKACVRAVERLWGSASGVTAALAEYRVFMFEEASAEREEERGATEEGGTKGRAAWSARKVWEERQRGGRLPLQVLLRLRSRYLVDGVAIGSGEFLRRLTGQSERMAGEMSPGDGASATPEGPAQAHGRDGVAMRFGQWGGLRVLRDLRVRVVG